MALHLTIIYFPSCSFSLAFYDANQVGCVIHLDFKSVVAKQCDKYSLELARQLPFGQSCTRPISATNGLVDIALTDTDGTLPHGQILGPLCNNQANQEGTSLNSNMKHSFMQPQTDALSTEPSNSQTPPNNVGDHGETVKPSNKVTDDASAPSHTSATPCFLKKKTPGAPLVARFNEPKNYMFAVSQSLVVKKLCPEDKKSMLFAEQILKSTFRITTKELREFYDKHEIFALWYKDRMTSATILSAHPNIQMVNVVFFATLVTIPSLAPHDCYGQANSYVRLA